MAFADGSIEAELNGADAQPGGSSKLAGIHLTEVLFNEGLFFVGKLSFGDVEGFAPERLLYERGGLVACMSADKVEKFVSEHGS